MSMATRTGTQSPALQMRRPYPDAAVRPAENKPGRLRASRRSRERYWLPGLHPENHAFSVRGPMLADGAGSTFTVQAENYREETTVCQKLEQQ